MRVIVLGGAGRVGAPAARLLAASDWVEEIGIAGRDGDLAARTAAELGSKARAIRIDVLDEGLVASVAAGFDLVVNAAGPDYATALPVARAAIAAGKHACDIAADGRATEQLVALDQSAKAVGVIILSGIGHVPGLSNLLMLHAARQLDEVHELEITTTWAITRAMITAIGDAARMRDSGRVTATWPQIIRWATGPVLAWRDGAREELWPLEHETAVIAPDGTRVRVLPIGSTEPVTFPRALPGVRQVTSLLGLQPEPLNGLLHDMATRVTTGRAPTVEAALTFLETIARDPDRWLGGGEDGRHRIWATAGGLKHGRRARYTCWPARTLPSTAGALAAASLEILRGEITSIGVSSPEQCLDPLRFFSKAAADDGDARGWLHEQWS